MFHELDQLTVPMNALTCEAEDEGEERYEDEGRSRFVMVGPRRNRAVTASYLWDRWCQGKGRGLPALEQSWRQRHQASTSTDLWALNKQERKALRELWCSESLHELRDRLAGVMRALDQNVRSLWDLKTSSQSKVLRTATIIGCTTVGAAKQRGMLGEVAPDVVLVEEAGEILEAQVLSTIGEKCKQLILIGDHLQLRPKTECYALRKESGGGLDFDVSSRPRPPPPSPSQTCPSCPTNSLDLRSGCRGSHPVSRLHASHPHCPGPLFSLTPLLSISFCRALAPPTFCCASPPPPPPPPVPTPRCRPAPVPTRTPAPIPTPTPTCCRALENVQASYQSEENHG